MARKKSIVSAAYLVMQILGVNRLFRFLNRRAVTFITFHSVVTDCAGENWRPLRTPHTAEEFESWLRGLASRYTFIELERAIRILGGEEAPINNALVLTLDDAYRNNVEVVLPILQKMSIPAVFYVPTGLVTEGKKLWVDSLDYFFQKVAAGRSHLTVKDETINFPKNGRNGLRSEFQIVRRRWKSSLRDEVAFLEKLDLFYEAAQIGGAEIETFTAKRDLWSALTTWEELGVAVDSGLVTIGSHGVSHSRLALADDETVAEEFEQSKATIEKMTGCKCEHFAYPNGEHDKSTRVFALRSGYKSAVTSDAGRNPIGADPMTLKRLTLPVGASMSEVYSIVSGSKGVAIVFEKWFGKRRLAAASD